MGALCAGVPVVIARWQDVDLVDAQRAAFLLYAVVAATIFWLYSRLSVSPRPAVRMRVPLEKSRAVVLKLSALFSMDSLGGGFVVQSLLALWLFKRFDLSVETAGAIFFVAGLLSAMSQLASPVLADRIGLIKTMAYTHIPSNVFLMLAALMPTAPLAVAMLLSRTALSQMDVPARQSYVMSVVPPEERAAAASVTNVPRSLAAAFAPALGGLLLSQSTFGWPLIMGGGIKLTYDLLLLRQFAGVRPVEEVSRAAENRA
jgi:predicted MFS family arabinose efflux permease